MKARYKMTLVLCLVGISIAGAGEDERDLPKSADELEDYLIVIDDGKDILIKTDMEFRQTIEMEQAFAANSCRAAIEIEYYQKGSSAHVESTLTNDDCGASSGIYVIQIRYRGADQQSQSTEFEETWERADSSPVVVEKDYFVGDDVDILRVRSRKLDCTCAPDESGDGS